MKKAKIMALAVALGMTAITGTALFANAVDTSSTKNGVTVTTQTATDTGILRKAFDDDYKLNVMDCNADGRVDVFGDILLRQFILGEETEEDEWGTAKHNVNFIKQELIDNAILDNLKEADESLPAKIADINVYSLANANEDVTHSGIWADVTFSDTLTWGELERISMQCGNHFLTKKIFEHTNNGEDRDSSGVTMLRFSSDTGGYLSVYPAEKEISIDVKTLSVDLGETEEDKEHFNEEFSYFFYELECSAPSVFASAEDISIERFDNHEESGLHNFKANISLINSLGWQEVYDILDMCGSNDRDECSEAFHKYFANKDDTDFDDEKTVKGISLVVNNSQLTAISFSENAVSGTNITIK